MDKRTIPSAAVVTFGCAGEANRLIAGLPASARILRELAEAGFREAWLELPEGEAVDERAMGEIHRLAGRMAVRFGDQAGPHPAVRPPGNLLIPAAAILAGTREGALEFDDPGTPAEILRRTGKASDGPVSRWLNRPLSRRLSLLLLRLPGVRPVHATVGTALLALIMFGVLLTGEPWGLVAGGLLFQAASIFDGVDGELARATFRTSRAGAALDTAIDVCTSILLVVGVTANLVLRGQTGALEVTVWGLGLFLFGLALLGWHAVSSGAPFSFNRVKLHYRRRTSGSRSAGLIAFATMVTGRDFFTLLFALLLVAGLPMVVLYLFAAAASVWILFVLGSMLGAVAARSSAETG